ncbi:type II toxin-antitoxin system RelE/ParE family toxin [Nocardia sp. NPDC051756]|uniref:type II toxin-antitoxin system RelE/ParE family toxin n=1 Tax=Nocardia sp. NPDC051756 TaxID=3154751 RepID=UPI0034179B72
MKSIKFVATALDDLREFPLAVRRECGYQLDRVQRGLEPVDWKVMPSVGLGVREIRVRDHAGAFRVIYVAKLADHIYVLHCFQKRSQKTSAADLNLAANRLAQVVEQIKEGER